MTMRLMRGSPPYTGEANIAGLPKRICSAKIFWEKETQA